MIHTPPPTTLSTPSSTEIPEFSPSKSTEPPETSTMKQPIYLIVATTLSSSRLGIGYHNTLPWPLIKSDMQFFAKLTRDSRPSKLDPSIFQRNQRINAVIMGRKTYESIPAKFRPLGGRLNVVISRTAPRVLAESIGEALRREKKGADGSELQIETKIVAGSGGSGEDEEASMLLTSHDGPTTSDASWTNSRGAPILVCSSISSALNTLTSSTPNSPTSSHSNPDSKREPHPSLRDKVGNIFVIGGSQIYTQILQHSSSSSSSSSSPPSLSTHDHNMGPLRILQTQVHKLNGGEFTCDTFFPLQLGQDPNWKEVSSTQALEWFDTDTDPKSESQSESQSESAGGERTKILPPQGNDTWGRDEKTGVQVRLVGWERQS